MRPEPSSIRLQLVVATASVSLLVALLLLPFAHHRIESSFRAFEAGYADQELRRLEMTLQRQARELERTAIDYSRWDSAVEYVLAPREQWLEDNLTADVFDNFHVTTVLVADRELDLVSSSSATGQEGHDPKLLRSATTCTDALQLRKPRFRFQHIDGTPHVVVCSPVISEDGDEPAVGVMLWTMALDAARLAEIEQLVQFPFDIAPLQGQTAERQPGFHHEIIEASFAIEDSDGRASLLATMHLPRPLGTQRVLAQHVVLIMLAIALATPPLLLLLLLELFVVRRIRRVSQWVRVASMEDAPDVGRLPAPVAESGFAELAMLTHDFDALTRRLQASRADWRNLARRDSLTGLGNRAGMMQDLEPWLAANAPVALLLVDLDGFKAVNDMHGHPAGDQLLCEVARDLVEETPSHASSYRLGGDEFAVVWPDPSPAGPEQLARALCARMRQVRHTGGAPLNVSGCVGVALRGNGDPLAVSQLLAHADLALYEAKRAGRGSYRLFSAETFASHRDDLMLEAELRVALDQRTLLAWFQPIVDTRSGEVLAVEALARWLHPVRGWVPAGRFIEIAEQSGQVATLDLAVARYALDCFAALRELVPQLRLHVNMSAQSLATEGFVTAFLALAQDRRLVLALIVEVTEGDLSVETAQLQPALAELRAMGVQLAVDDFGIGASSLGRLMQLRPASVKIDGSFVRDIDGDGGRICAAIVELSRQLGMSTVAKYVETPEQAKALEAMGCDALQGFGVCPPLQYAALRDWLSQRAA